MLAAVWVMHLQVSYGVTWLVILTIKMCSLRGKFYHLLAWALGFLQELLVAGLVLTVQVCASVACSTVMYGKAVLGSC